MKILAFTDSHGSPSDLVVIAKKASKADIIVCAGDFTIFENEIQYIMQQLEKLPKKVLIIHGNHEEDVTVDVLAKHFTNIEFIHKKIIVVGEYAFIGYGGGGFSTYEPEFEMWIEKNKEKLKGKKVVLVTHGPPYGTKCDKLASGYAGNKSFTSYAKKEKPTLLICGHLHELFYKKDKIGKTLVINPGPEGVVIEI